MNAKEAMECVFKRCEIIYNDVVIGREHLIRAYQQFLNQSFYEENHNVSLVMHTGSICFDVISVVFGAISSLALNEGDIDNIIDSLEKGDIVVYEGEKYRFEGFTEEKLAEDLPQMKYAILYQDGRNLTSRVPEKNWYKIKPYYGESKSLDGRGIRRKENKRSKFMSTMFGIGEEDIPSVIESSVVLVMPKQKADSIINNVVILDRKEGGIYNLLDLVTASYYTEGGEVRYSGNSEKADPNLKITSRLSVARDLIYQPLNNPVYGLMVLETDGANQSRTELDELLNRRSLKYVFASYSVDSDRGEELAEEYNEANLFACTKEYLLQNSLPLDTYNTYTARLEKQVDIIIDKELETKIVPFGCTKEEYYSARKGLRTIKKIEINDENKENYIVQASSLLNLMITAPFSMKELDNSNPAGYGVMSVSEKLNLLEQYTESFSGMLREKAIAVTNVLKNIYMLLSEESAKEIALKRLLTDTRGKKTAIIIPKAYYENVLKTVLINYTGTGKISFFTPNRFNNDDIFDLIIVLGDYSGKRFSPFKCNASKHIVTFLYEFEKPLFNYKQNKAKKVEKQYNKRIKAISEDIPDIEDYSPEDNAEEINDAIIEIDEFIESMNSIMIRNYATAGNRESSSTIEAVRIGTFVEGESILFSKNYKAVVFNEDKGEVSEEPVENLEAGDVIVFTKRDNVTKGIVDEILENLLERQLLGNNIKKAYEQSQYWKEVLRDYKLNNDLKYEELAKRLSQQGSTKHYATIRNWIQPFSYIVGPRDEESFLQIAEVTQDEEMLANPIKYKEACDTIRTERRRILDLIAAAIVKKLGGKADNDDKLLKAVYDNIDSLAVRKQLDTITDINDEYAVPIGMVNRPISI